MMVGHGSDEKSQPGPDDSGRQPLDDVMTRLGLSNADLVRASTEQLTHKMVQKGRKGRRLTPNARWKILSALQRLKPDEGLTLKELFNY
jgi:hypothetical protein